MITRRADLTVAAIQSIPVIGDVEANLEAAETALAQAAEGGARLVLFPELSLTGYDLDRLDDPRLWFAPGDARLDRLRKSARAAGAVVVVGVPVRVGQRRYLASLALSGNGPDVVAPKSHLHGAESDIFDAGHEPVVVQVADWSVGLAVCFDTAFAQHAENLRTAGAHAYAASVIFTEGEERELDQRMASRAADNNFWTIAANLGGSPLGRRSAGGSGIWSPQGAVLARAAGRDSEIVFGTLTEASLSS
ncbi:carbon-nitrogen hydrolase family protein [Kineosporia sp. NBRC 101677]|uniref:carbon-nitrogen hydrolase family protein n=1 Tax=Kineosporia sp. NBRC 101677 TaxID=3032197 RepID=UPI002556223F|nr:carbon-nitrogen hydrolase family protein [Kineosporia sp. NBRC 101677]